MNKQELRKYIEKDKPKTALEYIRLISQNYIEYKDLEDKTILKMATWSRLNNQKFFDESKNTDWNKLNTDVLELISQLKDIDYRVELPETEKEIKEDIELGRQGKSFKKGATLLGIISLLLVTSIIWNLLDRKQIAFDYFFSNIQRIEKKERFESDNYSGNWKLANSYIIRCDTLENDISNVYYTIGEKAEVYLFRIDSAKLGGIEYIINAIYKVKREDTLAVKASIEAKEPNYSLMEKIETISVIFQEEININNGNRTGYYVGRFEPENRLKFLFSSFEKKDIVNRILKKYNIYPTRKCKIEIDDDTMSFIFKCFPIGDKKSVYIKKITKIPSQGVL